MITEPHNPDTRKRAQWLRHRWLWIVALLVLLLWTIYAIHHALQPKYLGKTTAEWIAEGKSADALCYMSPAELAADPTVIALRHLGTNAIWHLWHEYTRRDSRPTQILSEFWYRLIQGKYSAIPWGERRQVQAEKLLIGVGTQTEILIPALIDRLDSPESDKERDAVWLLGYLHQRAEIVVPVLTAKIRKNRFKNGYLWALIQYGPEAKEAVPVLRALFASQTTNKLEKERLAFTILKIDGKGPELDFLISQINPRDYDSSRQTIEGLGSLGPIAEAATPALVSMARNLTNVMDSNRVVEVIQMIDPKGIHPKP